MKKILFILVTLNLTLVTIEAQPSITWSRLYDGGFEEDDVCNGICRTTDGNFVLGGVTYNNHGAMVLKINDLGIVIWRKHFFATTGQAITATNDGGVLLVSPDFLKIGSNGDSIWYRNFTGSGITNLYDVKQSIGGGFITCGRAYYDSGYVMKTDENGNFLWGNLISDSLLAVRLFAVNEVNNDGFIATGYAFDLYDFKLVVVRIGPNGERRWVNKYEEGNLIGRGIKVINKPLYHLIVCTKGYLKIDDEGNVIDTQFVTLDSFETIADLQLINNNRYSLVTNIQIIPTLTSKLRIIDSSGYTLFFKTLDFSQWVWLKKSYILSNGDMIFSGEATHFDSVDANIYVIRSDSNLNFPPIGISIWSQTKPKDYNLYQNYPNPFNNETIIEFDIIKRDRYSLKIYDVLGREIEILLEEDLGPGHYRLNYFSNKLSTGVYFYQLKSSEKIISKKMIILK